MTSGTDIGSMGTKEGICVGRQKEIACECWFTSKGEVTPIMLKIRDEDGEIRTIRQIQVHSQREKKCAGVSSVTLECTITILKQEIQVWLVYYKERNRWVLIYR